MTNTKMNTQKKKESSPPILIITNGHDSTTTTGTTTSTSASAAKAKDLISITNSISHHITLHSIQLQDEFEIVKTLAEGCFAKLILVKKGSDKMVLKAIHSEVSSESDFRRELNYNYFLSPHPNIVTSFNVSFSWDNCYVFVQEYAPFGDLSRFVKKGGLPSDSVKLVASQLSSALDFMHGLHLVHRDLKLENILVFKTNLSIIKLCDFGYTYPEGSLVSKTNTTWLRFCPPELCSIVKNENYYAHSSSDVWQVGIILFVCLTGEAPWSVADITDSSFVSYTDWLKRKCLRMPECFNIFTQRFIRLLKRLLEPKPSKRVEIREITKYLNDKWIRSGHYNANNRRNALGSSDGGHLSLLLDRKESMNTTSRSSQRHNKSNITNVTGTHSHTANNNENEIGINGRSHNNNKSHSSSAQQRTTRLHGNNSFRHTRSKSCRKSLKIYGIETEIDKSAISERVINWISNSSNNNNNNNEPDINDNNIIDYNESCPINNNNVKKTTISRSKSNASNYTFSNKNSNNNLLCVEPL